MSPFTPIIRRPSQIDDPMDYIAELEDLIVRLWAFREAAIGWREKDWPEGFNRDSVEQVVIRAAVFEDHAAESQRHTTEEETEAWTKKTTGTAGPQLPPVAAG